MKQWQVKARLMGTKGLSLRVQGMGVTAVVSLEGKKMVCVRYGVK